MAMRSWEEQLEEKLLRYTEILIHIHKAEDRFDSLYPGEREEYAKLLNVIRMILLINPGILVSSFLDAKMMKLIVGIIWGQDDEFDLDIYIGAESDFGQNMVQGYFDRVRKLGPVVVSLNPDLLPFKTQLQEAVRCFAHGLNTACFILLVSVLETALRDRLKYHDGSYELKLDKNKRYLGVGPITFTPIVELAYREGIIHSLNHKKLLSIAKLRNDAIHEAKEIEEEETVKALEECIRILEHLYKRQV